MGIPVAGDRCSHVADCHSSKTCARSKDQRLGLAFNPVPTFAYWLCGLFGAGAAAVVVLASVATCRPSST